MSRCGLRTDVRHLLTPAAMHAALEHVGLVIVNVEYWITATEPRSIWKPRGLAYDFPPKRGSAAARYLSLSCRQHV